MLHRIEMVGEIAFILLFVFGITFAIIDEKKGRRISKRLQKHKWPTVVIVTWATIAIGGLGSAIFSGHMP